ncbi:MAG: response regulator [Candidatus Abyssobacteria bacterium SURF_17]|uniref:histidine kinase n=1 Tax=Candidatus Abyssobacteria bacterium SURF_17 TaxID=2093361 RepID=A0A419F9C1_9BACT|nr:MAG: response regulator [Candidatus Abyssubacteria bacterium SURF_17]
MDVIVVASSEDSIQESLHVLLSEEHIVVEARTLPHLLNALIERPVDVIIIDEFLQNTDCVSVYQQLRSLSPDMTCVMLAVQTRSEMAREMRAKGVYDIVAKPFDKEVLLACIGRALERSHMARRLAAVSAERTHGTPAMPSPEKPAGEPSAAPGREMLNSLRKFLRAVADVFVPERLYPLVLDALVEMVPVSKAVLLLYGDEEQQMRVRATVGVDASVFNNYPASAWAGVLAWLRRHDQILNLDDPDVRPYSEEMLVVRKDLELLQARACVPLVTRGRLIGILALGKKVTGRRLSEAELEFLYHVSQQIAAIIENARQHRAVFVQKERFEEILQSVTSGLMATDSEGRVIVFNKAAEQMLGLKASEAVGQSIQRVGSVFADIVFRTLREEKAFCRHEVVDPATKSLLGISSSLLTDVSEKPVGAVVLFTDLSTVKRRGGENEETFQRCALSMAHEIKNPLVAIRTFSQLFPESYADEKFRKEFSEIALREIDKLDGVVERLLRFSQPLELRAEPGDINSLLEELVEHIVEGARSQNIVVKKDFMMANGGVLFDRNLLREALEQIFQNALEAMPSGGTLTVSTSVKSYPGSRGGAQGNGLSPGMYAEIAISDTGTGIGPEEMTNLFKPFHTSKVKGLGLGLAISRRIIRGHNGDIEIASEPSKGTVVKLVLPQGANCDA